MTKVLKIGLICQDRALFSWVQDPGPMEMRTARIEDYFHGYRILTPWPDFMGPKQKKFSASPETHSQRALPLGQPYFRGSRILEDLRSRRRSWKSALIDPSWGYQPTHRGIVPLSVHPLPIGSLRVRFRGDRVFCGGAEVDIPHLGTILAERKVFEI